MISPQLSSCCVGPNLFDGAGTYNIMLAIYILPCYRTYLCTIWSVLMYQKLCCDTNHDLAARKFHCGVLLRSAPVEWSIG
jgi:hypothetical protein